MRMVSVVVYEVTTDGFSDDKGESCFGEDSETSCFAEESVNNRCRDRCVKTVDGLNFSQRTGC